MKKRFTEEQILDFLKQAEAGVPVKELCRRHGFSDASFYTWRAKFGGMTVADAKRLKDDDDGAAAASASCIEYSKSALAGLIFLFEDETSRQP